MENKYKEAQHSMEKMESNNKDKKNAYKNMNN